MEHASSGSAGSVVAVAVAAEVELEREVQPGTVAPDAWFNRSTDRKKYWAAGKEADLKTEDFHLHHLHL